jgi:SNF2 family DNA or RNA helicase
MAKFILQRAERQVDTGEDIYAVRKAMEQLEKDGFAVKKGMHRDGDNVQASHILVLLLRLRQICCHTSLVKNVTAT